MSAKFFGRLPDGKFVRIFSEPIFSADFFGSSKNTAHTAIGDD